MTRGAAWVLMVAGLAQMAADVARMPELKAVATATGAAPAPEVFSAVRGLETYSTRLALEWVERGGERRRLDLTAEVYRRVRGPYNRRNVYGAALAYGPVLAMDPVTRPLLHDVLRHALCGERALLRELGVDPAAVVGRPRVLFEARAGALPAGLPAAIEAPCA